MTDKEKYISDIINKFQINRGIGYFISDKKISYLDVIKQIITSFNNKNPNDKILIVINNEKERTKINRLFISNEKDLNIVTKLTKFINNNYYYDYKLCIFLSNDKELYKIKHLKESCKFILVVYNKYYIDNEFNNNLNNLLPKLVSSINIREKTRDNSTLPVEEIHYPVLMTDEDYEGYKKYTSFIEDTVSIFGDLYNINFARVGNSALNISPAEFREKLAKDNGWDIDLDFRKDYNKKLDLYYNPNSLLERANNFFSFTNNRTDLCQNNVSKLPEILNICNDYPDKKILIVSKSGKYCSIIVKYLEENNYQNDVLEYHNDIEDSKIKNDDGSYVTYTSGAKKGQIKIFKSKALSSLYMERFKSVDRGVLVMKYNSDINAQINADLIIFTSSLSSNIVEFANRYNYLDFNILPVKSYILYIDSTIEDTRLKNKQIQTNVTITKNNNISEDFDGVCL